ncbi:hypothetical protein NDU88_004363 [Pleurodeles waltl]|uniref:Uncharacterized protein n=1 Tax=Pleurodeles waltl TaxID=8319 RepID=A0AAV7WTX7_PLEWA|nr:hypothetical protein NDU88_004363 [Pleurodeles waltl]
MLCKGRGQDGGVSGRVAPSSADWALNLLCGRGAGRPVVPCRDAWDRRGHRGLGVSPRTERLRRASARTRKRRLRGAEGRWLFVVASPGPIDCWLGAEGAAAPLEGAVPPR